MHHYYLFAIIYTYALTYFSFSLIYSPRDSTCAKMVEYVLGGSPTNKESPLSALEPRLRNLKFDDNDKVSPSHIIEYIHNNMHFYCSHMMIRKRQILRLIQTA